MHIGVVEEKYRIGEKLDERETDALYILRFAPYPYILNPENPTQIILIQFSFLRL